MYIGCGFCLICNYAYGTSDDNGIAVYTSNHPEENARFVRINNYTISGGSVMGWLGNSTDNWVECRDVYVSRGGNYTFRLSNATGWAPDIDKFELIPEGGTTLIDDPFDIQTSVKTVLKPSDAKICVSGNLFEVIGRNVQDVRLFAMNGRLTGRKGDEPFSFIMPVSGSYLAVIRYYNDRQEAVQVVI